MKRNVLSVALALILCFVLSGCELWMDGEYLSVTPHHEQNIGAGADPIEIDSYAQLPEALTELVASGVSSGAVIAPALNHADLRRYLDEAVEHVKNDTPIGAYAVESISYEIGTNRGNFAVAFYVNYFINRADVLRIKQAKEMDEATQMIGTALDECEDSLLVLVDDYRDVDLRQTVRHYAYQNPDKVMEIPQVTTRVYPETGSSRLIEIRFTYQNARSELLRMKEQVDQIFTSAELYVKESANVRDIYTRLFSFLMERHEYSLESSVTPSYSLLLKGNGDSSAFANVYAAMCRRAGLDCRTVNGTKNGMPWSWNMVRFRGTYLHVDLLDCNMSGEFTMHNDSEMVGYVWE